MREVLGLELVLEGGGRREQRQRARVRTAASRGWGLKGVRLPGHPQPTRGHHIPPAATSHPGTAVPCPKTPHISLPPQPRGNEGQAGMVPPPLHPPRAAGHGIAPTPCHPIAVSQWCLWGHSCTPSPVPTDRAPPNHLGWAPPTQLRAGGRTGLQPWAGASSGGAVTCRSPAPSWPGVGAEGQRTPMAAFRSVIVTCFARSTAWTTCCWCWQGERREERVGTGQPAQLPRELGEATQGRGLRGAHPPPETGTG